MARRVLVYLGRQSVIVSANLSVQNTSNGALSWKDFGSPAPGATSSTVVVRVANSGVDAPASCFMVALTAVGTYSGARNNQGQECITEQWIQAQEGAGPWTPIGGDITVGGNRLSITAPPAGSYTEINLRLVIPAGATTRGPFSFLVAAFYPVG